jgi:hypothetical protein
MRRRAQRRDCPDMLLVIRIVDQAPEMDPIGLAQMP